MGSFGDNSISTFGQDWLGRSPACQALQRIVQDSRLDMPLTLGIYGSWGSGKTSIMRLLAQGLPEESLVVWFNAWEYAQQREALWRAFMLALVNVFRDEGFIDQFVREQVGDQAPEDEREAQRAQVDQALERVVTSLYRSQTYQEREGYKINWQAALRLGGRSILRIMAPGFGEEALKAVVKQFAEGKDIDDAVQLLEARQREEYWQHVQSLEQFRQAMCDLIDRYVNRRQRRLFVFVDDLDRCMPEDAIGVLEAIKVFFNPPANGALNCVFVLGMDRAVVEQGIRVRYREFAEGPTPHPVDARLYLDKIIQLPFNVPPLNTDQIEQFIRQWCAEQQQPEIAACSALIAIGVAPNPRSVKRTLNVLRLMHELHKAADNALSDDSFKLLAKIIVMQTTYDDVYQDIIRNPDLLLGMEKVSRLPDSESPFKTSFARYPRLARMISEEPFFPRDNAALSQLIFFSRFSQNP